LCSWSPWKWNYVARTLPHDNRTTVVDCMSTLVIPIGSIGKNPLRDQMKISLSVHFDFDVTDVYMYTGFSCPVNSLYIDVGIVFM